MSVSRAILTALDAALKAAPPTGIKDREIRILPEGEVPAVTGERWLTIHGDSIMQVSNDTMRRRQVEFSVSVTQRIKRLPNDRRGTVTYIDTDSMSCLLESVIDIILNGSFYTLVEAAFPLLPPSRVDGGYDENSPPATIPKQYEFTETLFSLMSASLDPEHVYGSDFWTRGITKDGENVNDKAQLYDKLAGYRMTAKFASPPYWNPYGTVLDAPLTGATGTCERTAPPNGVEPEFVHDDTFDPTFN